MNILDKDGIVIRKIPEQTVSHWTYREGDEQRLRKNECVVEDASGRKMIQRTQVNKLAGYAITFCGSQDATVVFSKARSGFGETPEAAYADFLKKKKRREQSL